MSTFAIVDLAVGIIFLPEYKLVAIASHSDD